MTEVSAILLLVLTVVMTNGAVNYCGARMCGRSDAHTFCKYRSGPSASCTGYMSATLSVEEKARILARLNRRRSEVALGWRHWPPAGDMMKLRWIEELAREAQRWADQCRPPRTPEERDVCRDLYSITVGQCVASIVGEAPGLRPESMVDMWYMQSMAYDGNVTTYKPSQTKNVYGDFAQMLWAETFLVGCGRSRFMTEWRGRLRSVERLVCNFAPRGPVPGRALWTPAHAVSICPPRAHPDTLPGLCTYQNDFDDSRNVNDSLSVHNDYLLETVFEIEKNDSLDYLGRLDELYLTKIAVATIATPTPVTSLYYSLQKRDVVEQIEEDVRSPNVDNENEAGVNNLKKHQLTSEVKPRDRAKLLKSKVNVIGRPKPYDMNELNDVTVDRKLENFNDVPDIKKDKEIDLYADDDLVEPEDENVKVSTTETVLALTKHNENTDSVEVKSEYNEYTGKNNTTTTESMVGSGRYLNSSSEDATGSVISEKTVEDYLSDPETVRALQDALDNMERTLASPITVATPGKVRRELRNLEADLQDIPRTKARVATPRGINNEKAVMVGGQNQTSDRGPMLSMVLKYMPYLKPYESSIIGQTVSRCEAVHNEFPVFICTMLSLVLVL